MKIFICVLHEIKYYTICLYIICLSKVKIEFSRFQIAEEIPLHEERMLLGCGRFNNKEI